MSWLGLLIGILASLPDKSEKYMKTIVAFANTQGGKLIVGVDDKTHQIVGVENDVLFQLMDGIANAVYDDRLEVTSPGGLYNGLTYEEVMNGHSKIRNKGIANIFSQMGLVEAWGSGIKRIFNAAEEYGLPTPRFQEFDNMFRVDLFRNSFPMTNEKEDIGEDIGETSEKHRRNIGVRVENRPQRYTAKDYKVAFRRSSIISS